MNVKVLFQCLDYCVTRLCKKVIELCSCPEKAALGMGLPEFLLKNWIIVIYGLPFEVIALLWGGFWKDIIVGLAMFFIGNTIFSVLIMQPNAKVMKYLYLPIKLNIKSVLFAIWFSILAIKICVVNLLAIGICFFYCTPPVEGFYRVVFLMVAVSLSALPVYRNICLLLNMKHDRKLIGLRNGSLFVHSLGILGAVFTGYAAYSCEKGWVVCTITPLLEFIGLLWMIPSYKKFARIFSSFAQGNVIKHLNGRMRIVRK